jgi:ubiquinone biosynthesis protein
VKFGQVLSTRRDLLPPEFITELARLQDRVSPLPWEQIEQVLGTELGGTDIFAEIDREPLASASMAQVHAATLRTGERVVIKVLRPGLAGLVERDLDIIARLARRTEARAGWARAIGVVTLAEGFAIGLREEMDFRVEAANLAAAGAASAAAGVNGAAASKPGQVVIPRTYHDLSTRRVLVMERLDGKALSHATPADGDRDRLARELLDCVLRQIVIDGIFHADPHPGNIMLLDDGRLGLIDFGSVGRLDSGLRAALQRLLLALERRDPVALTDALLEVTARPDDLDEQALERSVGALLVRHLAAGRTPDFTLFTELFRLVARHELAVPPEFASTFRALSILEGGLTLLAPRFDIVAEAERFGQTQLATRLGPASLKEVAAEEVTSLLPMLRRLPRRVDRIAAALEGGRLNVNIRALADERDRKVITGWVQLGVLTVLAATAGFMAVALLALKGGPAMTPAIGLYQFLGYCLLVICALLALRVLAAVFRTGALTQQDAADERGLADVLRAVVDHADQPHAQRHRRIPALVHDPGQVGVGDAGDQPDRLGVHRVVVAGEQVGRGHRDLCYLLGGMPVPGVVRLERQLEPLAVLGPHLRHPERVRHVVVLNPGQVPHQPGDRVRVRRDALRQLAAGQPPYHRVHVLLDPAEGVRQYVRARHLLPLPFQAKNLPNGARDTPSPPAPCPAGWSLTVVRGTVPTCPPLVSRSHPTNQAAAWAAPSPMSTRCSPPPSTPSAARNGRARFRWPRRCGTPSRPGSTWRCRPAPAPGSRWPTWSRRCGTRSPRAARSWWPPPPSLCRTSSSTATCRG